MITFDSAGAVYTLELSFSALKRYQVETGETPLDAINEIEKVDLVRFGKLFQVSVKPVLTEEQTDALIDAIGFKPALDLFAKAVAEAFPNPEGSDAPKPTAPSAASPIN